MNDRRVRQVTHVSGKVLRALVLLGQEVDVDDLVLSATSSRHTSTRATFVDLAGPNTFTGAIALVACPPAAMPAEGCGSWGVRCPLLLPSWKRREIKWF